MHKLPFPNDAGWRMPAEWERHSATWIAWPHNRDDWPGKFEPIPWVYVEIVRLLHRSENVNILVESHQAEVAIGKMLQSAGIDLRQICYSHIATNRVWTRDFCPIFLVNDDGQMAALDWRFNAWAKYDDWEKDNLVNEQLLSEADFDCFQPTWQGQPIVLEGGSIDVNGRGLLLTTEECLLSTTQQRNSFCDKETYETVFRSYLGVHKTLWLNRGIAGDDTHGHIDDLARFAAPRTVVAVVEQNRNDDNYEPLKENYERLQKMTDADGRSLQVVTLPMPAPVVFDGRRLPASYANFYIANDCVLVPTFNDPHDRDALSILAELFPTRSVVGIHAVDLVWGLGTLHCLTQQQPRVQ